MQHWTLWNNRLGNACIHLYYPCVKYGLLAVILGVGMIGTAHAAEVPRVLTYTYKHHIIQVSAIRHTEWKDGREVWLFRGMEALPPAKLLTCGEEGVLPEGWTRSTRTGWNEDAIRRTIEDEVIAKLRRNAGSVTIARSASGSIHFTGSGLTGRDFDSRVLTKMTIAALTNGVDTIALPVIETQPRIDVQDAELRALGIQEVVTIGESVFIGSPVNRRHNIDVGVRKFNGHLIPQGSIFSFVEVLGPVTGATGYRKELVIQGDTTIPDYGGGLCQVSSTAYRGPWEYGLPIVQRKNHSYAVSYYSPQGTDATIYPPNVDIKFLNDTPGALLIQSFVDETDHAYFIYYGTRDTREAEVFGPYIFDRRAAPKEERTLYTTDIPVGAKRKAGERHDGMKVLWYRSVAKSGTGTAMERYFSSYEARSLTYQIGVTASELERMREGVAPANEANEVPSWIGTHE